MNSLDQRVAVVTGGCGGIGSAIVIALASSGFDIVVVDIEENEKKAHSIIGEVAESGRVVKFIAGDISDATRLPALAAQTWAAFGRVQCLVNNAGILVRQDGLDILDLTPKVFDQVLAVNLRGTFFFTQAMAKLMIHDRDVNAERSIITISSGVSGKPRLEAPEYTLSKTGLSVMSQIFALRLAEYGIKTYEIRPGIIRTAMSEDVIHRYEKMLEDGRLPLRRLGMPGDVAQAVSLIASGALPYSTGDCIYIDGGLHLSG